MGLDRMNINMNNGEVKDLEEKRKIPPLIFRKTSLLQRDWGGEVINLLSANTGCRLRREK